MFDQLFADWILIKFSCLYRYEKLQRWEEAYQAYSAKCSQTSNVHPALEPTLGLVDAKDIDC